MEQKIYWIWLADVFGPATHRVVKLLRCFGNAYNVFHASDEEILETGLFRLGDKVFEKLKNRDLSAAEKIYERTKRLGAGIITPDSIEYPRALLALKNSPIVLYGLGRFPDFNRRCAISVVGSRSMSGYGMTQAYSLGYSLASAGAIVVSGLALGIDGVSMAAAIDAGGSTVGIIGNGIDTVYPRQHKKLYSDVLKNGAVITEYPPGTAPSQYTFPQRNRLVSGISQATVLVESRAKSGALITAYNAKCQGKPLFAIPGPVDSVGSEGPIKLIREGVALATCARDILEEFMFTYTHSLDMEKCDLKFTGANWESRALASVAEHKVSFKPCEEKNATHVPPVKPTVVHTEEAETAKAEAERSEEKEIKEVNRECPYGFYNGKGKVDSSLRINFEMLGENEKKVFFAMRCDTPLIADEIKVKGLSVSDVLASLTLLEMAGAIEAGAGGYYMRSGEEDLSSFFEN